LDRSASNGHSYGCSSGPPGKGEASQLHFPRSRPDGQPIESSHLERFPITWNHVIDKESLKIKTLEQVLIEKVCQLFRNLL
ncbi:MAG: hypothetical protein FJX15_06890, partial [Alphaproteobacteria bacterium]|nr:hypothetical protein [Alphaproteobacteria bacterium]